MDTGEGHLAGAGRRLLGVVEGFDLLRLSLGVVLDDQLQWAEHTLAPLGAQVHVLAQAVLEESVKSIKAFLGVPQVGQGADTLQNTARMMDLSRRELPRAVPEKSPGARPADAVRTRTEGDSFRNETSVRNGPAEGGEQPFLGRRSRPIRARSGSPTSQACQDVPIPARKTWSIVPVQRLADRLVHEVMVGGAGGRGTHAMRR